MSRCKHVVPVEIYFSDSQLEDLDVSPTPGGTCNIIYMRLKTTNPPTNVAVKCFRRPNTSYQDQEGVKQMINNELKIWKLLNNNPNVVQFLGVITTHSRLNGIYIPPWPVCEYHENNRIDYYLKGQNANAQKRFQLLIGVIRGLIHIHSMEIVHGDLKASNIVVNNSGSTAKICDFGSSRIRCICYDGPEDQAGTAQWDSPELGDDEPRSESSDIWAFGCVALETQFSKFPYHIDDMKMYRMQMRGLPPATESSIDLGASLVSKEVWGTMQRCWQWDPSARPTARSVLEGFEALEALNVTGAV